MWKSIAFFLVVFTLGLAGLLIVSGDLGSWLHPKPGAEEKGPEGQAGPAAVGPGQGAGPVDPNQFKMPVFDVQKGRLSYTILGHLNESELKNLPDITELDG